ncbi:MAG: cupin domain-containing protein [Maribacter sp.]|nr:cupin domain-containing protein [Maribacter sp.]
MKVMNKPELIPLEVGDSIKTMQVNGLAGMTMPRHHATKEAVIVVQEGRALLRMSERSHTLKKGSTLIIPAGKEHTLTIQQDFKAIAIMAVDSEINFI